MTNSENNAKWGKIPESIPSKINNKTRVQTLYIAFQYSQPEQSQKRRKEKG